MKKLLFGLSAILLCFMMASCGDNSTSKDKDKDKDEKVEKKSKDKDEDEKAEKKGNPLASLQSLIDDIEDNGNEWTDEEKWDEVQVKAAEIVIDFAESDPSEDEFEEFKDAMEDLNKAIRHIDDEDAKKAMDKAGDKFEKNHKDLYRDLEKAQKKLRKITEKYEKDEDDDDYDDSDYDEPAAAEQMDAPMPEAPAAPEKPASADAPLF